MVDSIYLAALSRRPTARVEQAGGCLGADSDSSRYCRICSGHYSTRMSLS